MTPSVFAPKTDSRCALYAFGARHDVHGKWDKRWIYDGILFVSTPVQHAPVNMPAGVPGTVGQVQERLVRAPRARVQKPHGENKRAVQNPLI